VGCRSRGREGTSLAQRKKLRCDCERRQKVRFQNRKINKTESIKEKRKKEHPVREKLKRGRGGLSTRPAAILVSTCGAGSEKAINRIPRVRQLVTTGCLAHKTTTGNNRRHVTAPKPTKYLTKGKRGGRKKQVKSSVQIPAASLCACLLEYSTAYWEKALGAGSTVVRQSKRNPLTHSKAHGRMASAGRPTKGLKRAGQEFDQTCFFGCPGQVWKHAGHYEENDHPIGEMK